MSLSDAGSSSSVGERGGGRFAVEVMDVFEVLAGQRVDILKMDIEGGEYEVLADHRLAVLDISAVVMEWHARGKGNDDRAWCVKQLEQAGYVVREIFSQSDHGMLWARREKGALLRATLNGSCGTTGYE